MRIYALIPVQKAFQIYGLSDLQLFYSGINIRGVVTEIGLYRKGIGLAIQRSVEVQVVAVGAGAMYSSPSSTNSKVASMISTSPDHSDL